MKKQDIIEKKLDDNAKLQMGRDLNALISLNSRYSIYADEANQFIKDFSISLGFTDHRDTAYRIIKYMYPSNRAFWIIQDKRYEDIIKESAWLKLNGINV